MGLKVLSSNIQLVFVCKPMASVKAQNKKKPISLHRHKEMFFPKVPNPSDFFKDMFENKNEMTRVICFNFLVTDNYHGNNALIMVFINIKATQFFSCHNMK